MHFPQIYQTVIATAPHDNLLRMTQEVVHGNIRGGHAELTGHSLYTALRTARVVAAGHEASVA